MAKAKGSVKSGGRSKGTPNKRTVDIKGEAQKAGPKALAYLVKVMEDDTEDTRYRITASNSILDRAYGKAAQSIVGDKDMPVQIIVKHFALTN